MIKHALFVRLEAKPGKEKELAQFLEAGLGMAQQEGTTPVFFALQLGPSTFGIFDAFTDEAGRQAHLNGPIAQALGANAPKLLAQAPSIERIDVLGVKLPGKTDAGATKVTLNLEVQVIPVSSVELSKKFYQSLGWRLDDDVAPTKDVRIVQFTPPGSGCSITFGKGITAAAPGSAVGTLVVSDIKAAHEDLVRRGIAVSEMWHGAPFPLEARLPGPDPKRTSYGSFCAFNDPDGNAWLVQEVTTRRPGHA
jgi:quinol monooxygenase YgiN/catechol 2,3-dioxygenase-like lactoylglutathione lyase family enzyme